MTQLGLFDRSRRVRRPRLLASGITTDSRACSHAAGLRNAQTSAATQRARLLALVSQRGAYGLTDAEASEVLGIRRYVVPARRAEIMRTHRLTTAGRRDGCAVWVLEAS